jgi:hypothetical protein
MQNLTSLLSISPFFDTTRLDEAIHGTREDRRERAWHHFSLSCEVVTFLSPPERVFKEKTLFMLSAFGQLLQQLGLSHCF